MLTQRLQDAEAQDVFAQMGGMKSHQKVEKLHATEKASQPPQAEQEQHDEEDVYAGLEIYEEYR